MHERSARRARGPLPIIACKYTSSKVLLLGPALIHGELGGAVLAILTGQHRNSVLLPCCQHLSTATLQPFRVQPVASAGKINASVIDGLVWYCLRTEYFGKPSGDSGLMRDTAHTGLLMTWRVYCHFTAYCDFCVGVFGVTALFQKLGYTRI